MCPRPDSDFSLERDSRSQNFRKAKDRTMSAAKRRLQRRASVGCGETSEEKRRRQNRERKRAQRERGQRELDDMRELVDRVTASRDRWRKRAKNAEELLDLLLKTEPATREGDLDVRAEADADDDESEVQRKSAEQTSESLSDGSDDDIWVEKERIGDLEHLERTFGLAMRSDRLCRAMTGATVAVFHKWEEFFVPYIKQTTLLGQETKLPRESDLRA